MGRVRVPRQQGKNEEGVKSGGGRIGEKTFAGEKKKSAQEEHHLGGWLVLVVWTPEVARRDGSSMEKRRCGEKKGG